MIILFIILFNKAVSFASDNYFDSPKDLSCRKYQQRQHYHISHKKNFDHKKNNCPSSSSKTFSLSDYSNEQIIKEASIRFNDINLLDILLKNNTPKDYICVKKVYTFTQGCYSNNVKHVSTYRHKSNYK
jgi:hypothetical protein